MNSTSSDIGYFCIICEILGPLDYPGQLIGDFSMARANVQEGTYRKASKPSFNRLLDIGSSLVLEHTKGFAHVLEAVI
jgi:hypothetical protein